MKRKITWNKFLEYFFKQQLFLYILTLNFRA